MACQLHCFARLMRKSNRMRLRCTASTTPLEARAAGHRLVIVVGDKSYYGKAGFKPIPAGRATMPGAVDPARLLVAELVKGAFAGVSGLVRPE